MTQTSGRYMGSGYIQKLSYPAKRHHVFSPFGSTPSDLSVSVPRVPS